LLENRDVEVTAIDEQIPNSSRANKPFKKLL